MNITVVGAGYVGLVTGTCLADFGHNVTCVDIDERKIAELKRGKLPIYEQGLQELIVKNVAANRLSFISSLQEQQENSHIFFIAVGTPSNGDGSANLDYVLAAARDIGRYISDDAIIVDKSTVPVGVADKVRFAVQAELDARNIDVEFDLVSNPEFLKEGDAVDDFMKPERVIIGSDNDAATAVMHDLYLPIVEIPEKIITMSVRDAEMAKYVTNAMLAARISFINEVAILCDEMDVNIDKVRLGIGSDSRIGLDFLRPGCGYGGSCFPKDVKALVNMAHEHNVNPIVLQAIIDRNQEQKELLFTRIAAHFGKENFAELTFAVWGLAFKPETDDMREASSIVLLRDLIKHGAKVNAYDPVAMANARKELPQEWFTDGALCLADNQYATLDGADALVLVTEWHTFSNPDFAKMKNLMKQKIIFDGRNQYDPAHIREQGFFYQGIGR